MALNTAQLSTDLTSFFTNLPQTEAECADAWSEIIGDYTVAIVPPVVPATHAAAVVALRAALIGMNAPGAALGVFQGALATFAGALAGSMPPAPPGGNVAPPTPIPLAFGGLYSSVPLAVNAHRTVIDTWFRTGTSNAIPWS